MSGVKYGTYCAGGWLVVISQNFYSLKLLSIFLESENYQKKPKNDQSPEGKTGSNEKFSPGDVD